MNSVKKIVTNNDLTALETSVVIELANQLQDWIGCESYSPVECSDIGDALGMKVASVKGIVGSLTKKGIVEGYEHEECRGWDGRIEEPASYVINFVGQDEMETYSTDK